MQQSVVQKSWKKARTAGKINYNEQQPTNEASKGAAMRKPIAGNILMP